MKQRVSDKQRRRDKQREWRGAYRKDAWINRDASRSRAKAGKGGRRRKASLSLLALAAFLALLKGSRWYLFQGAVGGFFAEARRGRAPRGAAAQRDC